MYLTLPLYVKRAIASGVLKNASAGIRTNANQASRNPTHF